LTVKVLSKVKSLKSTVSQHTFRSNNYIHSRPDVVITVIFRLTLLLCRISVELPLSVAADSNCNLLSIPQLLQSYALGSWL
jgi:hypothetical protein